MFVTIIEADIIMLTNYSYFSEQCFSKATVCAKDVESYSSVAWEMQFSLTFSLKIRMNLLGDITNISRLKLV